MLIKRFDQDWFPLLDDVIAGDKKAVRSKKLLRDNIVAAAPIFADRPFFMSEEFSLIDCALAPLLWRLPSLGIDISTPNNAITNYTQRIFNRPGFKNSLSETEREMAEAPK